jgi:two-component system, chemotaxis family, protein-glutamate methylesterase/glutaminase
VTVTFSQSDFAASTADKIRVAIVDDSVVVRSLLQRWLANCDDVSVVGTAADGKAALVLLEKKPADIVILDIAMPVMDGLEALPKISALQPHAQIIISSTLTSRNAEISLHALDLGAADYVTKPSGKTVVLEGQDFFAELLEKIRVLGRLSQARSQKKSPLMRSETKAKSCTAEATRIVTASVMPPKVRPAILAIGCSTGGPQALFKLLSDLPKPFSLPIVIVQHMPPIFTNILAQQLTRSTSIPTFEAHDKQEILPGHAYIAPGDFHMRLVNGPTGICLSLTQEAPVNYCRPAVDPFFASVAKLYGDKTLALVLTGMGRDGTQGAQAIQAAGGAVLVQDEESSVVWGMPGSVARAGLATGIAPLSKLPGLVSSMLATGDA